MSQENSQDKRIQLHVLHKSEREEIHFSINYYQSHVYLDIRTWLKWSDDSGSRPSSKGISIPLEHREAFKEGVLKLLQQSESLAAAHVPASSGTGSGKKYSRTYPPKNR